MVSRGHGRWNGRQAGSIPSFPTFPPERKNYKGGLGKMQKRFISLWFRHLTTDWIILKRPALKNTPFVLAALSHGRMLITASNAPAQANGVDSGMAVADARLLIPSLEVLDDHPDLPDKLLR